MNTTYKTPKSAIVSGAIELTNLSDSVAELVEKGQFAKARTILETDLQQLVETLLAQLETH